MKIKILIKTDSFKSFLKLFNEDEIINNLELGDTWHPSDGFVDESILEGKNKIQDILAFPYDFKGLVLFKGNIKNLIIKYNDGDGKTYEIYEITGIDYEIRAIENKIIEFNSYNSHIFEYSIKKIIIMKKIIIKNKINVM